MASAFPDIVSTEITVSLALNHRPNIWSFNPATEKNVETNN